MSVTMGPTYRAEVSAETRPLCAVHSGRQHNSRLNVVFYLQWGGVVVDPVKISSRVVRSITKQNLKACERMKGPKNWWLWCSPGLRDRKTCLFPRCVTIPNLLVLSQTVWA